MIIVCYAVKRNIIYKYKNILEGNMGKKYLNGYIFLSLALLSVALIVEKPSSVAGFLNTSKQVIEILSPIGLFLIGYLGLNQWRIEIDFKEKKKLAEIIALKLLLFIEIFDLNRKSWGEWNVRSSAKITGDPKKEDKSKWEILKINIQFDQDKYFDKVSRLEKVRYELEIKLKAAATTWNNREIENCGDLLFNLFYDFQIAVARIRNQFPENEWVFEKNEIENNKDLHLIHYFYLGTKDKSAEELNSYFDIKIKDAKKTIMENISLYLSTDA